MLGPIACSDVKHKQTSVNKQQHYELTTLHRRRYPDYWLGFGRIRLLGRRINPHFIAFGYIAVIALIHISRPKQPGGFLNLIP
jgi:hypothetical protein